MTLEQLNQMLEEGKITQEVFDELSKGVKEPEPQKDPEPKDDDLEKKIQSIVDRATNKLGNENKRLKEQIKKMEKEKMTDDEIRQYDLAEKEKEIEERETRLKAQENRMYAIKAIKKAGLDDGSDTSLEIVDLVMGADETEIDTKVKAFKEIVDKRVQAEVDKTFKANGGRPPKGGSDNSTDNPYKKETFNLSKQMELELTNPELAKQLQAQAGV